MTGRISRVPAQERRPERLAVPVPELLAPARPDGRPPVAAAAARPGSGRSSQTIVSAASSTIVPILPLVAAVDHPALRRPRSARPCARSSSADSPRSSSARGAARRARWNWTPEALREPPADGRLAAAARGADHGDPSHRFTARQSRNCGMRRSRSSKQRGSRSTSISSPAPSPQPISSATRSGGGSSSKKKSRNSQKASCPGARAHATNPAARSSPAGAHSRRAGSVSAPSAVTRYRSRALVALARSPRAARSPTKWSPTPSSAA